MYEGMFPRFWCAFYNENVSTIQYPMLLVIIEKCFLYFACCMEYNKI